MGDFCLMKEAKTWLILGATEGLGPAAAKYLSAKGQLVIPIDLLKETLYPEKISAVAREYGPLDFIINNANYSLFHNEAPDIIGGIAATASLMNALVPYLRKDPKGSLINIPPQLCLATLEDKARGKDLLEAMARFLSGLHRELLKFNCGLSFLEPGERLF